MSRNGYLVCYDVRDSDRLRRTHKTMLGFREPLQYSVFFCDLSAVERMLLEAALRRVVKLTDDAVLIVDLGPSYGSARRRFKSLGRQLSPEIHRAVIV